tara:strand:- start:1794 stop:1985 length:192 start_codon:yes stop_codon:yes gene_type:complete
LRREKCGSQLEQLSVFLLDLRGALYSQVEQIKRQLKDFERKTKLYLESFIFSTTYTDLVEPKN